MKRAISFALVMVMCLALCACRKSQAVQDVENAIQAIGEISLESNDAILKAERLYDNLTDGEKAEVENKALLVEARFTYDKFYNDKVYQIAKETYGYLCDAANLYYFDAKNFYAVGTFGKNSDLQISDPDFCKKFADLTIEYWDYPQFTEQEIRVALNGYCAKYEVPENARIDYALCANLYFYAFENIRNYDVEQIVKEAGVLLLELKETYHDEKYEPILTEYRDFVASGSSLVLNSHKLSDISTRAGDYQTEKTQYEMKISPMFVD